MTEKDITEEITSVLEEIIEEPEIEAKASKPELVTPINDNEFLIDNRHYKLVVNHREGFDAEKLSERYSDILARYDYIVGDWGYDQLRLKGFFDKEDRKAFPDQRIDMLEDYLYEYCNFGCAYFVLQRVGGKKERTNTRRRKKKPASQAHVAEKKEPAAAKKQKPVIKNRTPKEKAANPKPRNNNEKKGFTIRQREE